ncbi:MAG: hypothetical protein QM569_06315, partial [Acidovorax sp.]|uniref:hypothetical protein n=1 Tax=Acidovorax sp. TaxID=1872122 RepID=UPI0039E2D3AA
MTTRSPHPRPPQPRPLRALAWHRLALAWLVLALVAVPTVGRLHQVVHANALQQMHAGHAPAATHQADPHPQGLLQQLVAGHTPVDCLLLDQLALGDALHGAPLALPATAAPLAPPARHAGRA